MSNLITAFNLLKQITKFNNASYSSRHIYIEKSIYILQDTAYRAFLDRKTINQTTLDNIYKDINIVYPKLKRKIKLQIAMQRMFFNFYPKEQVHKDFIYAYTRNQYNILLKTLVNGYFDEFDNYLVIKFLLLFIKRLKDQLTEDDIDKILNVTQYQIRSYILYTLNKKYKIINYAHTMEEKTEILEICNYVDIDLPINVIKAIKAPL